MNWETGTGQPGDGGSGGVTASETRAKENQRASIEESMAYLRLQTCQTTDPENLSSRTLLILTVGVELVLDQGHGGCHIFRVPSSPTEIQAPKSVNRSNTVQLCEPGKNLNNKIKLRLDEFQCNP